LFSIICNNISDISLLSVCFCGCGNKRSATCGWQTSSYKAISRTPHGNRNFGGNNHDRLLFTYYLNDNCTWRLIYILYKCVIGLHYFEYFDITTYNTVFEKGG